MIGCILIGIYVSVYLFFMGLLYWDRRNGGCQVPWWMWITMLLWPATTPLGAFDWWRDYRKWRKFEKTKESERNK